MELLALAIGVACMLFIIKDSKQRGMSGGWAILGLIFNLVGLLIYFAARKPIQNSSNDKVSNNIGYVNSNQSTTSKICLNCKNPITSNRPTCEWCGSQIG